MGRLLLMALAGWAIILVAACGSGGEGSGTLGRQATVIVQLEIEEQTGLKTVRILEVDSGTKFKADIDGGIFDVRYIGIRLSDPDKVLADGRTVRQAAFELARSLLPDESKVKLEKGAVERDLVGTLYRYVYDPDGEMVNIALLAAGLSTVRDDPSDTTYQAKLLAAQEEAKANLRGVWEQ